MAEERINNVVGESFEDLEMEEMLETQGAGDIDAETTPVLVSASAALTGAAASYGLTNAIVKSAKNSRC